MHSISLPPQLHSRSPCLNWRSLWPHLGQSDAAVHWWTGQPIMSVRCQCASMNPFSATHRWHSPGFTMFKSVGTRLCPSKRAQRGCFGGAKNPMLSSSDVGRLMIAANFSNLKPLVRISLCFRSATLYTLHGEA